MLIKFIRYGMQAGDGCIINQLVVLSKNVPFGLEQVSLALQCEEYV